MMEGYPADQYRTRAMKLEERLREVMRFKHYSLGTEVALMGHADLRTTMICVRMARSMRGEIGSLLVAW